MAKRAEKVVAPKKVVTVKQIKAYIKRLRSNAKQLHAVNAELREQLDESETEAREQIDLLEAEVDILEREIERLGTQNKSLAKSLKKCQAVKTRAALAISDRNEWKMLARRRLESGQMSNAEWRAVLDALLFSAHDNELGAFNTAVEHGFRALYARSDAAAGWNDIV